MSTAIGGIADGSQPRPKEIAEYAAKIAAEERLDGLTHKKAVTAVVDALEINRRRVNEWAAKYDWVKP